MEEPHFIISLKNVAAANLYFYRAIAEQEIDTYLKHVNDFSCVLLRSKNSNEMTSLSSITQFLLYFVLVKNIFARSEIEGHHKAICSKFPIFMRRQTTLSCSKSNSNFDFNDGLKSEILYNASRLAGDACEEQFQHHLWNCSARTFNKITSRASPETSFLFAIYSAGLAHSIAIACSQGLIENCMCPSTKNKVYKLTEKEIIYEDTSCTSNSIVYGITESRKMLRNDKESDPRWKIDEHNKEAGRLMLRSTMIKRQVSCHCHGASGACAVKKCTQLMPSFKLIGNQIKLKYKSAIHVGSDNNRISPQLIPYRSEDTQLITEHDLVYNQPSPNFCELDKHTGSLGTRGRVCSKNSTGPDNCKKLCCGRGYSEKTNHISVPCRCKFAYCCDVTCETCHKTVVTQICN